MENLITRVMDPISGVLSEFIEDKDERNAITAKVKLALVSQETQLVQASRDVVVAEAQGESFLQRNWRPIIMLTFGAILANNYILVPWLVAFGVDTIAVLDMPEGLWTLLSIGLGGYVVGRTIEKTGSSVNIGGSHQK